MQSINHQIDLIIRSLIRSEVQFPNLNFLHNIYLFIYLFENPVISNEGRKGQVLNYNKFKVLGSQTNLLYFLYVSRLFYVNA